MRRHHARVLGLCLSLMADRAAADDAAAEVFLKAYRSLDRFQGASSFSTWLYRIASNHCLDLMRRRGREKTDSLEALVEAEGDAVARLIGAEPDAARRVEDEDLARRLLERLPADYQVILALREVQGLSYEELAEALECTLDSVKARLKRARAELERALRHFLESGNV